MLMGLAAWWLCWGDNDLVERECVFEKGFKLSLEFDENELRLVFLFLATLFMRCAHGIHAFFKRIQRGFRLRPTYFFASAKK
jgi:hypothetical protein